MPTKLEVGHFYKTRGGWKARVIYVGDGLPLLCVGRDSFTKNVRAIAVHDNPNPPDAVYGEEVVVFHTEEGQAIPQHNVAVEPPRFGKEVLHPADIIDEI